MRIVFSVLVVLLFSFSGVSQSDTISIGDENLIVKAKDTSYWTNKAIFGLNGTQSSFVNWSAGGRNNVSVLGFIDASAVYQRRDLKWNNELKLALGGLKFVDDAGLK